jgi:hypothetical protein
METTKVIVTIVYLSFLIFGFFLYRVMFLNNSPARKHYFSSFFSKIGGAALVGVVYEFYYGGYGDTFYFYNIGSVIHEAYHNTGYQDALQLLQLDAGDRSNKEMSWYISGFYSWYFKEPSAFFVGKISGIIGIITGNSYANIAFTFAGFSFIGNWCLFSTLQKAYPGIYSKLTIPILFIPSVIFWGSGLFKDTLVFGALGILFATTFSIIFEKKNITQNIILFIIFAWFTYKIKDYVLFAFIPAATFMALSHYKNRIKITFIRKTITPLLIIVTITAVVSYLLTIDLTSTIDEIGQMQAWHEKVSADGSSYTLGEYDESIFGIASKILPAINVTLFRPYLWETSSSIMLLSSIESQIMFLIFIYVLLKNKLSLIFRVINKNPIILFMLIFTSIISFLVGFTSYNFGALVRYKIPIMPFFISALILIRELCKKEKIKEVNGFIEED